MTAVRHALEAAARARLALERQLKRRDAALRESKQAAATLEVEVAGRLEQVRTLENDLAASAIQIERLERVASEAIDRANAAAQRSTEMEHALEAERERRRREVHGLEQGLAANAVRIQALEQAIAHAEDGLRQRSEELIRVIEPEPASTFAEQARKAVRQVPAAAATSPREVRQLDAALRRRTRELEQLRADVAKARADVARAAESRSWRLGHGLMKLLRTASLRPSRGTDSLVRALARMDMVGGPEAAETAAEGQALADVLPAPSRPASDSQAGRPDEDQDEHELIAEGRREADAAAEAGQAEAMGRAKTLIGAFIRGLGPEWVERSHDRNQRFVEDLHRKIDAPRVIVGTLYSGEHEFARCKASVARQNYGNFEHMVIEGLPKQQAVSTLMDRFLASGADLMVKVDADMVLLEDDFISRVVQVFGSNPDLEQLQMAVLDFFSGGSMQGINAYRRTMDWQTERQDPLFTDRTFVPQDKRLVVWAPFSQSAIHAPDSTPFHAFHFGVHRGLKVRQPLTLTRDDAQAAEQTLYLEKTWEHFKLRRDIRLALACLGFELTVAGQFELGHVNYSEPDLERAFLEYEAWSVEQVERRVVELRGERVSPGSVEQARKHRRRNYWRSTAPIDSIVMPLPHFATYGGVNRFFQLAECFEAMGVECALTEPDRDWRFYHKKQLPATRPDYPTVRTVELSEALGRSWDVVLCGDCTSGVMLTMPLFQSRLSASYLLNGWRHREANARQIRLTLPDIVIANSSWAARFYRDLAPVVVPGGINLEVFAPGRERPMLAMPREEAAWSDGQLRVGAYGGRRKPIKRFEDVVEACRLARAAGVPVELHVFDEREHDVGLEFPFTYHGSLQREEVAALMRSMDLVISAEQDAGWSNPAAEAMASGTTLICTEAGTCDFAVHEETALVVPIGQPAAIAAAVERLWHDPALAYDLRRAGVQRIARYAWPAVARELLEVFQAARRDGTRRQTLNTRARRQIDRLPTGLAVTG